MEQMWSDEDVEAAWVAWRKRSEPHAPEKTLSDAMRRVMSEAISIFLARASGQVKEDVERVRSAYPIGWDQVDAALSRLSALSQDRERLGLELGICQQERAAAEERASGTEQDAASLRPKVAEWKRAQVTTENLLKLAVDERNAARAEVERLKGIINTPGTDDFIASILTEAAHQQERWGAAHDTGKEDSDWFWLLGFLAGKAIRPEANPEKKRHHVIATAAVCLNWHRHLMGHGTMRPGIEPPRALEGDAPQDAKCTCDMLQRDTQWHDTDCPRAPNHSAPLHSSTPNSPGIQDGSSDAPHRCGSAEGACLAKRHPCSPTCTHEDAANSGHPERIAALSKRFATVTGTGALASDDEWIKTAERTGDAAFLEQSTREARIREDGKQHGFSDGAEAMREALLREAKAACDQHGVEWLYQHLKHRFEGATP